MLEVDINKKLDSFNLEILFKTNKGVLAILGASGSGKSMMLKCISGLITPDRGLIKINGQEVYSSKGRVNIPTQKRKIGFVFQNYALFPHMSVFKNIEYGLHLDYTKQKKTKVYEMIEKVHLTGLEKRLPSQLSGGQQQRVALARTLITQPELLLLDEPLSALDVHIKHALQKELIEIIKNNYNGITLIVTHNIEEAYALSHNIMIMEKGQPIQYGTKHEIIQNPKTIGSARLTGCKNIFKAEIIKENEDFYMLKLGSLNIQVKKKRTFFGNKVFIGIRAHHIIINPKSKQDCNTFHGEIISKIEGVFSTTILIKSGGIIFEVTVSKSDCPHIAECKCNNKKIYLPPDKIFLMNQE